VAATGAPTLPAALSPRWAARIPVQAWNHFFGLNLIDGGKPVNNSASSILASGGHIHADHILLAVHK
jgi:hypothetical protein